MECLICSEPINHAHLGVNSCRACAVFYKRTAESKKQLKCKGGNGECRQLNSKTTCRLCRFTRFSEILKKAVGKDEPKISDMDVDSPDPDSSSYINHESFYDCEPSTSQTPLLDRLRKGYSLACLIRHSGELSNRTKSEEQSEIRVGKLVLVPATYSTIIQHAKLCKEAFKAFGSHSFDDFRELDEESKTFIIKTSHSVMSTIDTSYRKAYNFPNDEDMRTPGYTTYIKLRDLEQFFDNCPDDIDTVKIVDEFRKGIESSGKAVRRYYAQVKPTDYEFLALLGLSLWSDEIANLNDNLLKLSMRNRSMIMRELHAYYTQQGMRNYAVRIGQLFCILVNFQNNSSKLQEDFHLYRMMNLFKEHFEKYCD